MNWYKKIKLANDNIPPCPDPDDEKAYQEWFDRYHHNIGHYDEFDGYGAEFSEGISLWATNRAGGNFERKDFEINDKWDDDDLLEYYDISHGSYWAQEFLGKGFHGRYDYRIKTVSITRPYDSILRESIPIERISGSLIKTLQANYGKDVKIMVLPERVYL